VCQTYGCIGHTTFKRELVHRLPYTGNNMKCAMVP